MELKKIHISDIGKVVTGKTPRTSVGENYGGNIPFLTPSDDLSYKSAPKTTKTLTEQGLEEVKNCLLPPHSVCVSCIGSDLGKVVITLEPTVTNQQFNSIIPNKNFNADFVYYLMTLVGRELNYLSKTSTAVPIINKSSFSNYEVEVPNLETQEKIASILSSLDSKIELNRRINDNLEEQAKALFKSWFVDSDRNEWVHYELGDITLITAGGDRPSKYTNKKTIECYVPIYSNGIDNEGLYGYTDVAKIHEESITISARGTIGYVCLRLEPYVPIVRLISIIPNKKELSAKYLYLWALTQNITGTGTTQQQLTVPIFRKTPISIPSDTKLKQFNSIADPLFSQIESNKKENIKLSTLRDTLLPKLMSGELSVEEVSLD